MRTTLLGIAIISVALASGNAQAQTTTLISGWDFSQYGGSGALFVDATFANVYAIDAQWSDLDTTATPGTSNPNAGMGAGGTDYNMGTGSGAFGRMYHDGSFGSSDTSPGVELRAATGSLASNAGAPNVGTEMSAVGSANVLLTEGQDFGADLKLESVSQAGAISVVFSADKTGGGQMSGSGIGDDWQVSFGGVSGSGSDVMVTVESSSNGASYMSANSVTLNATDSLFVVDLGTVATDTLFVRLGLPSGAQIDNVAIEVVPEAGSAAAGLASVLTLSAIRRERRRRQS